MSHKFKNITVIHLHLLLTHNVKLDKFVNWKEVRNKFSTMKVVKTNIQNKIENDFLTDSLMLYIEKDIASTFSLDSIVDDFEDLKERRVPFS